ncbi:MAG: glycosyltransferase family 4 protein, partial [Proteobacteria bacterium]|nr:glycosyltransferase family 4 protein [Pseudomonadota bacterium]
MKRPGWLAATSTDSLLRTLRANRGDLRFLQKSLTATLCTWEPMLRRPFIFDIDDAVFLGNRGDSSNKIAKSASVTICGNQFLAEHFSQFGEVVVLPTAVDSELFCPSNKIDGNARRPVIGWSGSSSGFKYLYEIEGALQRLLALHPDATLKIVADRAPAFKRLPAARVQYEVWSERREVEALQEFTVGVMPLADDLWARGKCSFKMLTYMAVGLPVVVSPVGMNKEVLSHGSCGLAARSEDEWVDAISCLIGESSMARAMGHCGRAI